MVSSHNWGEQCLLCLHEEPFSLWSTVCASSWGETNVQGQFTSRTLWHLDGSWHPMITCTRQAKCKLPKSQNSYGTVSTSSNKGHAVLFHVMLTLKAGSDIAMEHLQKLYFCSVSVSSFNYDHYRMNNVTSADKNICKWLFTSVEWKAITDSKHAWTKAKINLHYHKDESNYVECNTIN